MSRDTAAACGAGAGTMHGYSDDFVRSAANYDSVGGANVMVFRPTMDEFKNFSRYLEHMERMGAHKACGIAKIVPPAGWHPRPSRQRQYLDMDDFVMHDAVRETIEGTQGIYTKYNAVYKKRLTVKDFRELALSHDYAPPTNVDTIHDLERFYWRNTTLHRPIYGADTPGTLYDDTVDEWNINRLGTILDLIQTECKVQIKGVNTAYMYFGMWKTTFPWHVEDMDLYSINYLHYGAPKFWYGVSSDQAPRFESLADSFFHQSKKECRAYLRHKMHAISPKILKYHSIDYGTMVQNAGEFMVTFPKGYHAGFNCGYNCAESTNFALERWIDFGKTAVCCTCQPDAVHIDMSPFMRRYRRAEYEPWARYWYGDETYEQMEGIKRTQCTELTQFNATGVPTIYHGDEEKRKLAAKEGGGGESSQACARPKHIAAGAHAAVSRCGGAKASASSSSAAAVAVDMTKRAARLWAWRRDDYRAAAGYNAHMALEEPHCAVCQYFVSRAAVNAAKDKLPAKSRRLISNLMLSRRPQSTLHNALSDSDSAPQSAHALGDNEDYLVQCDQCKVAVHARCYGVNSDEAREVSSLGLKWLCAVCRNSSAQQYAATTCRMCVMRAGAMLPAVMHDAQGALGTIAGHYAHVVCALFAAGARFRADGFIELADRWWAHDETASGHSAEHGGGCGAPSASAAASGSDSLDDLHGSAAALPSPPAEKKRKPSSAGGEQRQAAAGGAKKSRRDKKPAGDGWNCSVCDTSDGHVVLCSACHEASPTMVHVTCGLHNGMSFEFRDWPALVALVCPNHNTYDDGSSQLDALPVQSRVVAWLDGGERVARGTVEACRPVTFCVVDFLDGSHTNDTPMGDIEWCECSADGCDGAHRSRARVRIRWPDGQCYEGVYLRAHQADIYDVRLEDGTLHDCTREDLFGESEKLPDIVLQRVQADATDAGAAGTK